MSSSLFSLVLPSFILYDMVLYVWTLVFLFSTFLSDLCSKPMCPQVFIHCWNMTISSYSPSLSIFPYMLSVFCISFCLNHLRQLTSLVSQDHSDTRVLFKSVTVSFFLDFNTITFSYFHHSLGLLNGLGFISIFYMVCLGLFFLKCGNGWWPSGTSLLPLIVLSASYFYCL